MAQFAEALDKQAQQKHANLAAVDSIADVPYVIEILLFDQIMLRDK